MFVAARKFIPALGREARIVVDQERELEFRLVAGPTPERDAAYLLTWADGHVPVEARREEELDAVTQETYYLSTITHVGHSAIASLREDISPNYGHPPTPRDQLTAWAAEALLAYGGAGNDLSRVDGYNRIVLNGGEMRLSDFGPYVLPQQIDEIR